MKSILDNEIQHTYCSEQGNKIWDSPNCNIHDCKIVWSEIVWNERKNKSIVLPRIAIDLD